MVIRCRLLTTGDGHILAAVIINGGLVCNQIMCANGWIPQYFLMGGKGRVTV